MPSSQTPGPTPVSKPANGAKPVTEQPDGWAPIFDAAMKGDCAAIKKLFKKPEDPKVRFLGCTPLLLATIAGHLDAVTLLLEKGADINDRDDDRSPKVTVTDPRLEKGRDWLEKQFNEISKQVEDPASKPPREVLEYLLAWNFSDDKNRTVLRVYWEHILLRYIGDVPRDIQRNYSPDLNLALIGTFDRLFKGHAGIRESARLLNSKLPTTGYNILDTIVKPNHYWVTERWSYDNGHRITVEDGIDSFLIDEKAGKITNKMINYHVKGVGNKYVVEVDKCF